MSARLKRLMEERAAAWSQAQEIRARLESEGRDTSKDSDDTQAWERALGDVERLSKDIEQEERHERFEGLDLRGAVSPAAPEGTEAREEQGEEAYRSAFSAMLRRGVGRLTPGEQDILERGYQAFEGRALATGTDTAGGYTVPEGFRNKMTEAMKAYGGLLSIVDVITTETGNRLPWPTNDDTANEGALLSENTQVSEQDLTFGENQLDAYTYTSKLVRVPLQLLQDSAFNLDTWLPGKLGQRIGRAVAGHLATGTGTNQPQGVVNFAAGVTGSVSATAKITYDDLVDLEHSVDPSYRGNAKYAMNDKAVALFRKLKDNNGNPLWVPSMVAGAPSTINGNPYVIDNKLPAPAPGAKSVFFGDFAAGVTARNVLGTQVLRLTERYADFLQVGFLGFSRWDSVIDDAAAVRAFQHGAAA